MRTTKSALMALCDMLDTLDMAVQLRRNAFGYEVILNISGKPKKRLASGLTAKECWAYLGGMADSLLNKRS